jgi:hypothetical protein
VPLSGSLLSALLAFAAMVLGLAVAVQVVQEMWKYVTSSRDIAYASVLRDFLGPFLSRQLDRPGVVRDLQVRGPFQFLWWRPSGKLLPMDADELVAALERTTGEWFQRAYAAIRLETSLQRGVAAEPSPSWLAFRRELEAAGKGAVDAHATDIRTFLSAWHQEGVLDAGGLLVAFHHQFLPQARKVGEHFDQLMRNYDFHYRRRNLRQTVVIALLLALLLDLPAGKLYRQAASLSPEAAVELAQMATQQYEEMRAAQATDTTLVQLRDRANRALAIAAGRTDPLGQLAWPPVVWRKFVKSTGTGAIYLIQCLVTALLICFGAPLLNDVTKALLRTRTEGVRGIATGEFLERTTITAPSASANRKD